MATSGAPAARYDEWADWYEGYIQGAAQRFTGRTSDALVQVLGAGSGPVLDLACGTGFYAPVLRRLGWTPLGLDLSRGQLRYARTRMPAVAADATRPPLRPGTLAAVSAIMCHTDIDDYAAALRALSPALRPGGVFAHVGVHPCYTGAFADRSDPAQVLISRGYWRRERRFDAWTPHGVRARVGATHLPVSDLLNAMTSAGFSIERVIEAGSPVPDVLAVRCRRLVSRPGPVYDRMPQTIPDLDAMARRVIDVNQYMTLGTLDADGRPRLSPVYYTATRYADFYWVSSPQARHSRNLAGRADVEIVIFDSTARVGQGEAVYLSATARAVGDQELEAVCPEAFRTTAGAHRFGPEELRGDAPLRLYVARLRSCEVHVPGRDPVHGRGVDTRQAADPGAA
jgi:SAM-dependent methyltransferase